MPSSKKVDVVEWQVFFSERAQREYYFNPKTNIVTWILPDDLHPANQPHQEEIVCTSDHGETATKQFTNKRYKDEKPRRWTRWSLSANSLTLLLLGLSATANLVLWRLHGQGAQHQVRDIKQSDWCSAGESNSDCVTEDAATLSDVGNKEALPLGFVVQSSPPTRLPAETQDPEPHHQISEIILIAETTGGSELTETSQTQQKSPPGLSTRSFDAPGDTLVAAAAYKSQPLLPPFLRSFASRLLRLVKKFIPRRKNKKTGNASQDPIVA